MATVGKDFYKDELKDKSNSEILENYSQHIYSNEAAYKTIMLTFLDKCTNSIVIALKSHEKSMNKNSISNEILAKKVFWLNIILTAATIIGTTFAVISFFTD
ncbi:MAG: hypothetical protein JW976_05495 [Syntrophaceae bacterium]|nr:hypothetical protein [Syntrophaceae bacterium]